MTTTKESTTKTVDMMVLEVVHRAASARLAKVRETERTENGVPKTVLADVGRAALNRWQYLADHGPQAPTEARRPPIVRRVEREGQHVYVCNACPEEFTGDSPAEARNAAKGHSATHTRPFRFNMDSQSYEQIKAHITAAGTSVAAVVQDGLEAFARTGKL